MIDNSRFILNSKASVRDAIKLINSIAIPNMALFVVDDNNKLLGTITDGDIRRGLLNGLEIDQNVLNFSNTNFKYIVKGENNFEKIKNYKSKGIRFIPTLDIDNGTILNFVDLDLIKSILPIDVVLMAGGIGERLKPLTNNTPKPMLVVGDKPIIIRNIDRLKSFGVSDFHVSVRYLAQQIEQGLKIYCNDDVNFNIVFEEEPLGTIGAINLIKEFKNDTVLLMNSDLLTNIDFEDFYQKFLESNADMQVATIPYNVDIPYAVMEITTDNLVTAFKEKPRYTYYSNAGIYIFKKKLIEYIPHNQKFDATHFMEIIIKNNKTLSSYPIMDYWLDIGRLEDFYKAQEDVKHVKF